MKKKSTLALAAVAAFSFVFSQAALAQNFSGKSALSNMQNELSSYVDNIVNIVFIISGVVAAVCLIPAASKYFKGEPQSNDALTRIGIGLMILFVLLAVIKAVI